MATAAERELLLHKTADVGEKRKLVAKLNDLLMTRLVLAHKEAQMALPKTLKKSRGWFTPLAAISLEGLLAKLKSTGPSPP